MLCILYGSKRLGRRRRHKTEGRSTTSTSAETQDEGFISPSSSMLTLTQSDSAQNLSTSGLSSASGETPKPQVCAVIFILQTLGKKVIFISQINNSMLKRVEETKRENWPHLLPDLFWWISDENVLKILWVSKILEVSLFIFMYASSGHGGWPKPLKTQHPLATNHSTSSINLKHINIPIV